MNDIFRISPSANVFCRRNNFVLKIFLALMSSRIPRCAKKHLISTRILQYKTPHRVRTFLYGILYRGRGWVRAFSPFATRCVASDQPTPSRQGMAVDVGCRPWSRWPWWRHLCRWCTRSGLLCSHRRCKRRWCRQCSQHLPLFSWRYWGHGSHRIIWLRWS